MRSNAKCIRKWIAQLMTVVMVLGLVLVSPGNTVQASESKQPTLSESSLRIETGEHENLHVEHKTSDATYEWSSEDPTIATVDHKGKVKGVKSGVTNVTCKITTKKHKNYNLTCSVTVIDKKEHNKHKVTPTAVPTATPTPEPTATPTPEPTATPTPEPTATPTPEPTATPTPEPTATPTPEPTATPTPEPTATPTPAPTATPTPAPTATPIPGIATAISTIQYNFNIANATAGSSITFEMTDAYWVKHTQTLQLTGDGAYSVNFDLGNAPGILIMGYFVTDATSTAVATLTDVTVNGTYTMTYNATLKVNSTWENGLANIWWGLPDGTTVAKGTTGFIAFTKGTSDSFVFYIDNTPSTYSVANNISLIKYDFDVTNAVPGTSITFNMQDSNWATHSQTFQLTGDGTYSATFYTGGAAGLTNLGWFVMDATNTSTITLTQVTLNKTHVIPYGAVLTVGQNSLPNIWSYGLIDGQKFASGTDSFLAFSKGSRDLITLNTIMAGTAPTPTPVPTLYPTPVPHASTAISTINYDFSIAGATAGSSITFKMQDTNWVEHTQTLDLTGDGNYTVSFDLNNAAGIVNMGYFVTDANSTAVATLNKVTLNGSYDLLYSTVLKVNSTWENGLTNIWAGWTDGAKIAEGTGGYLEYQASSSKFAFYPSAPVLSSLDYVKAMGKGWNLFNTYDMTWGTPPVVTQDLILAVKAKGYKSIRMPFTAETRVTLGADGHYTIDPTFLATYKQSVDWAVEAGLFVMVNLHHDSYWLRNWDGNTSSAEYIKYVDCYTQLATYFKDEPYLVHFETINEPLFDKGVDQPARQAMLDAINLAGYNAIRNSGGNNATRMIVIPTYVTSNDPAQTEATYSFIAALNDPNIIATVHFYSSYLFSVNLGITGFDELMDPAKSTDCARTDVERLFTHINDSFLSRGIGVIIGEYGLLGNDVLGSIPTVDSGEKLKYYELINTLSNQYNVCIQIWSGAFDRTAPYTWDSINGETLQAGINGERSSYSTGYDEIYLSQTVSNGVQIPLTLNGNSFVGIQGLTEGVDYTYDAATATITLTNSYVNGKFNALATDAYGTFAELVLQFSAGATWHQYLIKYAAPVFNALTGTTSGFFIDVNYNGSRIRNIKAQDAAGNSVGPNSSWWRFLGFGTYMPDYNVDVLSISSGFFDASVLDGTITFTIEFFDGLVVKYAIQKNGTEVTGLGIVQ